MPENKNTESQKNISNKYIENKQKKTLAKKITLISLGIGDGIPV